MECEWTLMCLLGRGALNSECVFCELRSQGSLILTILQQRTWMRVRKLPRYHMLPPNLRTSLDLALMPVLSKPPEFTKNNHDGA